MHVSTFIRKKGFAITKDLLQDCVQLVARCNNDKYDNFKLNRQTDWVAVYFGINWIGQLLGFPKLLFACLKL